MTGKRTLLSLKQLQPSLVSDGKTLLTLLLPPQRRTVEISLLYVHNVTIIAAELIVEGPTIPIYVTTYDGTKIFTAVRSLATSVLHSIAAGELINATASRHVRTTAVSFSGVVHRVSHLRPEFPHGITRPLRLVSYLSLPCPNLLCRLSQALNTQRQLCMFRMHLRSMSRMR